MGEPRDLEAAASQPEVIDALRPLLGSIDSESMRQANKLVDIEGKSVGEAAAFLQKELRRNRSSNNGSIQ